MSNLQYRQEKIQAKRKQTSFRDFVMEIASWFPLNMYKVNGLISRYPETERIPHLKSFSERESFKEFSLDVGTDFFSSYRSLFLGFDMPNIMVNDVNENSSYADMIYGAKNAYLSFSTGINSENTVYSMLVWSDTKDVYNSFFVEDGSQNIYQGFFVKKSYHIFFSKGIENCSDMRFCSDCIGCSNCVGCNGLTNKNYCIANVELGKEEYEKQKNHKLSDKDQYESKYSTLSIERVNSRIDKLDNAILCRDIEQGNNIIVGSGGDQGSTRMHDGFDVGRNCSDFYGVCGSGTFSAHLYSCVNINKSQNLYYCNRCDSCSFCLGCIGLKNKSYCILNKQYTKEEWYIEVDKIFGQMETDGTLGEFFPATMNPFYFNDTAAYLIDPSFTKEEVTAKGYLWRNEPIKVDIPPGVQTVKTSELDSYEGFDVNGKRTIDDEILKKVILDDAGNAYRIIPMELEFLRKYELPLPRKHWLDRMKENFRIN